MQCLEFEVSQWMRRFLVFKEIIYGVPDCTELQTVDMSQAF
ncbi:MAG TPA: hypothetical protein VLW06_12995 [Terriglobales bacterium]|nr:hypothetical protein [Terriglobales bacterium]